MFFQIIIMRWFRHNHRLRKRHNYNFIKLFVFITLGCFSTGTSPQFNRASPVVPEYNVDQWPTLGNLTQSYASSQHRIHNTNWGQRTSTPWPELGKPRHKNNNNSQIQRPILAWSNASPNTEGDLTHVLGGASDQELQEFSELLLKKETGTFPSHVRVNYQGRTTSRSSVDQAPLPLLSIGSEVYTVPTIMQLGRLLDNYVPQANVMETVNFNEMTEESDFLDAVIATDVMQATRNFLISKANISSDIAQFKNLLRLLWFGMYARVHGQIGSSGFEHVFLGELKDGQVSGLHNWLFFGTQEMKGNIDYLGHIKKVVLSDHSVLLMTHFKFHGADKPFGSMFIGTSPEFEMALYTTCFLLRADRPCPLQLNGKRVAIMTYTFTYRGKKLIGSAFPQG